MPPTETPPNPAPAAPPPTEPAKAAPLKIVTRRFGELDHTELVHLLDSLEGDQAKSRFRESIYISVIFYLALAWLIVYGPKYVFHTGTVVPSAAELKEKQDLTQMNLQNDLAKLKKMPPPKPPVINRKTLDQLQAMQRANQEAKAAREALPPPPAPAPAPMVAAAPPPPPMPSTPTPQPPSRPAPAPSSSIPDAPRPNNLPSAPSTPSIADAGKRATQGHLNLGGGAITDGVSRVRGGGGAGAGVEILSDTEGLDWTDYIKRLLRMIKAAWLPLIPEECYPPISKEGSTLIRFTIGKNGQLLQPMTLDDSTHDRAIDKAAWGSITGVGVFPPLPAAYKGDNLQLRIQFVISRNAPPDGY